MSTIGIALAAFNGEAFLPQLVDSLRAQTDADFRVLWQDDGSSDGTLRLLRDVTEADSRFSPGAEQGRHLGAKGNFLSLMRQLDTPAVALCDQDDVWHPDRLARCRALLDRAEAEAGGGTPLLVHSDCRLTGPEGQVLAESFFRRQGWSFGAVSLPEMLVQNNVTGCTVLMNAALNRLAASRADPARIFMHDWFLAQTAAAFGRILCIREPLVDYRQHGGNAVGASAGGLLARGLGALRHSGPARERIRLTYRQAEVFLDLYRDVLPDDACRCVRTYLDTERLPRLRRIAAVRRGGYRMQSAAARAGQMLFG